jgi:hypothetical protein
VTAVAGQHSGDRELDCACIKWGCRDHWLHSDRRSRGCASAPTTGATSCTVTGLTNGTAYTFTVTATNGAGDYQCGIFCKQCCGLPVRRWYHLAPPTGVAATAGDAQATVSWTAPTSKRRCRDHWLHSDRPLQGGAQCTTTGATSCTVTGLTNGTAYTFTVTATQRCGDYQCGIFCKQLL